MGKPTGFKEYPRELPANRPAEVRLRDYREIPAPYPEEKLRVQAARCMDCGVPFCHTGCPLGNLIPDWNDLIYRRRWREALDRLHATNNFPEFTGRLCPAPCEEACVLGINEPAVTIELIEKAIVEHGFENGWIQPQPPARRTGKRVAVVGSGPAGLACAQQLNRAGHSVTVFERADRIGGLLRYGIPDFKLEKPVLDRRLRLMEAEGVVFRPGMNVGVEIPVAELKVFDAVVLCGGATQPRDLPLPGRELDGILFAMDFLTPSNHAVAGDAPRNAVPPAQGKRVIVIGGGDTGSDCLGTALRQGAKSVTSFELMPRPPEQRPADQPWPFYPVRLKSSSSHQEGGRRFWAINTKRFVGAGGRLRSLITVNLEWSRSPQTGRLQMREVPGSEHEWPTDLVLLALGFTGPEPEGLLAQLGIELDARGNVRTGPDYRTNVPGVFAAGDMRRGQSLIVWAISEGREAARAVDEHLMGFSLLPTKGAPDLPRS